MGLGRDPGVRIPGDDVPLDREQAGIVDRREGLGLAAPVRKAEHSEPLGRGGRRLADQALARGEAGLRPGIGRLRQGDFILDDGVAGP